ncbi:hypothetical protein K3495_g8604 [Podosphaera aphanis]|nr:hypothetical protein K3495_g8604 [Podosphaera aphanis]
MLIKCLEEWRPVLQGSQNSFKVLADHKNLEYFKTSKLLSQRQVRWSKFLSQFNFQIVYRPGVKATRPDALSRKSEDRPNKFDGDDDRVKNRERTVLPESRFDSNKLDNLLQYKWSSGMYFPDAIKTSNPTYSFKISPVPETDLPIDELIDRENARNKLARAMIECLKNVEGREWNRDIRKSLKIAFNDCKVIENRNYYKGVLFVSPDDKLRIQILYRTHSSGPAGHPGRTKARDLIARSYWWPRMTYDVRNFVKACELCTRTKIPRSAPPGFLQPLPMPFRPWSDISVYYISPLPECIRYGTKYNHLLVVVCRLTKYRHFIPATSLDAREMAETFVSRVYCLHGTPDNIISDRGSQFVSQFWRELSSRLGITLKPSSAFHPGTDGQKERINSSVEQYLRAFVSFYQDDWVKWLPLAEFAGNNAISETTGVSPFFANYGYNPKLGVESRQPCPPSLSTSQRKEFFKANAVGDRFSRILQQLKVLSKESQQRYEDNANNKRADSPSSREGDLVYIDTRNMKTRRPMKKMDDEWAGLFEVLSAYQKACRVKLPEGMKIFPVLHTSQLRRKDPFDVGLAEQSFINKEESRNIRGWILERSDGEAEVGKWEFDDILDSHDELGPGNITYKVKWKHQ